MKTAFSHRTLPNARRSISLRGFLSPALAIVAMMIGSTSSAHSSDATWTVNGTNADLTQAGAYNPNSSVPTSSSDVVLSSSSSAKTAYTDAGTLNYGSLNDTLATTAFKIQGAGTLNLGNNSGNGVAPSSSDLIYLATNANLTLYGTATASPLELNVLSSGNVDVASGASLFLGQNTSNGTPGITITGTGTPTLTFTGGGLTTLDGTVTGVNLDVNSGTLYVPTNGSNATTSNETWLTGGTLTVDSAGIAEFGRSNSSVAVGAITDNGLVISEVSGSATQTFSGVISGTGGFQVGTTSTATDLSAANTFSGTTTFAAAGQIELSNQLALQNSTLVTTGANAAGGVVFDSSVTANAFTLGGLSGSSAASSNLKLVNNASTPAPITLSVGNNNTNQTYAAVLSGGGALTKIGTGTQVLSGANTYSGGTTVSGGNLQLMATAVSGTSSSTGTGTVAVSGGGTTTVSGTGGALGAVTVSGGSHIAPGVNTTGTNNNFGAAGALTLGSTGGLTLNNANLDFDLSSSTSSGNDKISTGALTLGTTLVFNFYGTSLATNTAYDLISDTGVTGFNAGNISTNFLNGLTGYTAQYSLSGVTTGDLDVTFITAVPEPSIWAMMLGGLAFLVVWNRRSNRRTA